MSDFLRFADNNEHRCIARDKLGLYGSIVVAGNYTTAGADAEILLSRNNIIKTIKHCIDEHQVLSTIIQADPALKKPRLLRAENLDLQHHVCFVEKGSLVESAARTEALLKQVHNERHVSPEVTPPWRVYIDQIDSGNCLVVFACSHSLTDGRSALNFHKTFLDGLNMVDTLSHDEKLNFTPVTQRQLLPAIEEAGNMTVSWPFLLEAILGDALPPFLSKILGFQPTPNEQFYRGAIPRPPVPEAHSLVHTTLHRTIIPQPLLTSVLAKCKSHQVRLTSLINHLTATSLCSILSHHNKTYSKFRVTTPVDLRGALNLPPSSFGCFASAVIEDITITSSPSSSSSEQSTINWPILQTSTQNLAAGARTLTNQRVALLRYVSDIPQWVGEQARKPAGVAFETSNLGVFVPSENNPSDSSATRNSRVGVQRAGVVIRDLVFSQSGDLTGAPLCLNLASVKGGSLNVVFTWVPGMLGLEENEDEERLVGDLGDKLVAALEGVVDEGR